MNTGTQPLKAPLSPTLSNTLRPTLGRGLAVVLPIDGYATPDDTAVYYTPDGNDYYAQPEPVSV